MVSKVQAVKFYQITLFLSIMLCLAEVFGTGNGGMFFPGNNIKDTVRDSVKAKKDSTPAIPLSSGAIKSEVKYSASDSNYYDLDAKKTYLMGDAKVDYQDISLKAAKIVIDWNTNDIYAEGMPDTARKMIGYPVFKQGSQVFTSKRMVYNYKTKKGKIYDLITDEGDGFVHVQEGKFIKTDTTNTLYARNAKYTTCNLEDPHFYIQATRIKIIPGKQIISGMAFMYIEGVPMPIILPFGFFPANSRRSSGIIIPAYGMETTRGYFLQNGGYYFGLSDKYDVALTGGIWTNGSYDVNLLSHYVDRYNYSGSMAFSFGKLIIGFPEQPSYSVQNQYSIAWAHTQDPKANPTTTFNASVDVASSNYLKYNAINPEQRLANDLNSSISFSKQFQGTPFSFSMALRHSENTATNQINFTLPDFNFTMSPIYPFRGSAGLTNKWYDNISLTYSLHALNEVSGYDSTIFKNIQPRAWSKGFTQTLPITTNLTLGHFTLTPNFTYNGYAYFRKVSIKGVDTSRIDTLENYGFYMAHTWSTGANLSTHVYGMFNVNQWGIIKIRHVLTPSIGFTYAPNFSSPWYGYNKTYTNINNEVITYSPYALDNGLIGGPGAGRTGALNFSLDNNLEMKVKSKDKKDTSVTSKKVSLIDDINISGNYNFLADTNKLSYINITGHTMLFNKINVNGGLTMDPYYQSDATGNDTRYYAWQKTDALGRIIDPFISLSTSFHPSGGAPTPIPGTTPVSPTAPLTTTTPLPNSPASDAATVKKLPAALDPRLMFMYPGYYANFNVPWNVTMGYDYYRVTNAGFLSSVSQTMNFAADLNLSPKWKLGGTTNVDLVGKQVTYSTVNIYRDLHCWEMSLQWVPFGQYKSYYFSLRIKAPSLRDVKVEQRKTMFDNY